MKTIIILLTVIALATLSGWQWTRLCKKTTFIARQNLPSRELSSIPQSELELSVVKCTGEYINSIQFNVFNQSSYKLLVPFSTEGKLILVERGSIKDRLPNLPNEIVELEGSIITKPRSNPFVKQDAQNDVWFSIDINKMSESIGMQLEDYIIYLHNDNSKVEGIEPNKKIIITKNHHIFYAIMWLALCISACCIFFIYRKKETKK